MPAKKPAKKGDDLAKLSKRLETLVVEWADPDAFKPNPWNPNRQSEHEFTMLCKSMTDAGFTQPIMVTEVSVEHDVEWKKDIDSGRFAYGDLVIVDGEHRWRAAKALELKPIPYVKMPYGAMQARLSTLQMNRARGSEDVGLATDVLRDLETLGVLNWAAESLDLGDDELTKLLADEPVAETFAADEFSESWTPAGVHTTDGVRRDGREQLSHTPAALAEDEAYQKRIVSANTERDRYDAHFTKSTYQLVLRFSGDEADAVRALLGDRPAERILEWCREEVAANA